MKKSILPLLVAAALIGSASAQSSSDTLSQLQEAHKNLQLGMHDYHGHRGKADQEVKLAIREIGGKPDKTDGQRASDQTTSDNYLQNAQSLLRGVVDQLTGSTQQNVQEAIQEIDIALKLK